MTTNSHEEFLPIGEVMRRCGLSKASVYLYVRRGTFPKQVRVGQRLSRWIASEVAQWMRERVDARAAQAQSGRVATVSRGGGHGPGAFPDERRGPQG
jgi:predicted DNA-binding transcriptional regulator AlpA